MLRFDRKQQNSVKQLSFNKKVNKLEKAYLLITTQNVAEEFNVNHCTVIWLLKQFRKVKELEEWVPHKLNENKFFKKHPFEMSSSLILCNVNEPFLK